MHSMPTCLTSRFMFQKYHCHHTHKYFSIVCLYRDFLLFSIDLFSYSYISTKSYLIMVLILNFNISLSVSLHCFQNFWVISPVFNECYVRIILKLLGKLVFIRVVLNYNTFEKNLINNKPCYSFIDFSVKFCIFIYFITLVSDFSPPKHMDWLLLIY